MMVPSALLTPKLDDLLATGRRRGPVRPWLGLYAVEVDDAVVVAGTAHKGPAERAGLQPSDAVLAVAGARIGSLADFFRKVWALGAAGVRVPLTIGREGEVFDVALASEDRNDFLIAPRHH